MRRTIIIIIVVILLVAGAYFIIRQRNSNQEGEVEILRQATVEQGSLAATVNATGSIEPEALVTLSFGLGGTVHDVNVVRGEMASEGDVLANLQTGELALAVQQSQDGLRIQELMLQQALNSGPSEATLATSQADIDAAERGALRKDNLRGGGEVACLTIKLISPGAAVLRVGVVGTSRQLERAGRQPCERIGAVRFSPPLPRTADQEPVC